MKVFFESAHFRRTALGSLLVFIFLLLRNTGLHFDENEYLYAAASGEYAFFAKTLGKSPLWHIQNWLLMRIAFFIPANFRYLVPYLFNILLLVGTLSWLLEILWAAKLSTPHNFTASSKEKIFWATVISPFFLFNSTQLMEETGVLALPVILWGNLLKLEQNPEDSREKKRNHFWIFISSFLALSYKETTLFPVATLFAIFFWKRKINLNALLSGVATGILFNKFSIFMFGQSLNVQYKYTGLILNLNDVLSKLNWLNFSYYFSAWIFFMGPLAIVVGGYLLIQRKLKLDELVFVALASIPVTLVFQAINSHSFIRYIYPSVWLSLIALTFLIVPQLPRIFWIQLTLSILCSIPLITEIQRQPFFFWPPIVQNEAYHSGLSVLPGERIHLWGLRAPAKICVLVSEPDDNRIGSWMMTHFLFSMTEELKVFKQTELEQFRNCNGQKAYVRRQFDQKPDDCLPECREGDFRLIVCQKQIVPWMYSEIHLPMTTRLCLP